MARTKTLEAYDTEIKKVKDDLEKAQKKCKVLAAQLMDLKSRRQRQEAQMVMDAFQKSGKSMDDILSFLGA